MKITNSFFGKRNISGKFYRKIILAAAVCFSLCPLYGNNLQISSLSVNQVAQTVTFTVSWDNSWRDANKWDAAWLFVKFRDCNAAATLEFTHGALSVTMTDHTIPAPFQATTANGTANAIDPSPDNTGIMLRRSSQGTGTVSGTVTLKVTNLVAGSLDIRVFGTEMVFIPQGAYALGDGNGSTNSSCSFSTVAFCSSSCSAMSITSEGAVTVNYASTCPTSSSSALLAGFPKGFDPFYIMKYEISQGQYADFLNTLGSTQATNRFPGQNGNNRHTIASGGVYPNIYAASRPDRACNFLSWTDVAAYLDWSCLRPLTEMQYEKAGRGFSANNFYERAWGSPSGTVYANYIFGPENGSETIGNPEANNAGGSTTYAGTGDGSTGPLRVGIYATSSTSTRLQTGGSYFGVMELSGNVSEYYATSICGVSGQPCASGITFGNGSLTTTGTPGEADNNTWPVSAASGNANNNVIIRGGSWSDGCTDNNNQPCNISYRSGGTLNGTSVNNSRFNVRGGRGGR